MLKINLTPFSELENKYWWIPDITLLVFVCFAGYYTVDIYFEEVRNEITENNNKAEEYRESYSRLSTDLAKFKTLDNDILELNEKVSSLKEIITFKFIKFKALVILEHLHNLKPNGIWFMSTSINGLSGFNIKAYALDNSLVAEYIINLKSTFDQIIDHADIRTYLYFDNVNLKSSLVQNDELFTLGLQGASLFEISGDIQERKQGIEEQGSLSQSIFQLSVKRM